MRVLPLAQFLQCFETEDVEKVTLDPEIDEIPEEMAFSGGQICDESVESARREGFEEGHSAALKDAEVKLQAERESFEEKLTSERETYMDNIARTMVERLEQSLVELQEATARALVVILEPFLKDSIRNHAIDEVISKIGRLIESDGHALMRVSGPALLVERIRTAFAGRLGGVEFVVSENADVTCLARDTVIETRLRDWIDALSPTEGTA